MTTPTQPKMHWATSDNTISQLLVDGIDLIKPWGIETADSSAFFSLEDGFGYRYTVIEEDGISSAHRFQKRMVVEMREGLWELTLDDCIVEPGRIARRAHLRCLRDSYFMDFVMRFRFRKELFTRATISNRHFEHRNTNIYHQYPVNTASLHGEHFSTNIDITNSQVPTGMEPMMYVRDHEDEWVVHARMLPTRADKEVIKLCNPWAKTRPIPQVVSRPLLKLPLVRDALWYRGEKGPFSGRIMRRLNPLACPLVKLHAGEELEWNAECVLTASGLPHA